MSVAIRPVRASARCVEGESSAHGSGAASEEMRGEGERGEEQECIGEVQAEVNGARRRAVLRGMAEEDKKRAEERFVEGEDEDGYGTGASEVTARDGDEGPDNKGEDAEEVNAAGSAMRKLDQGGDGGMMLDDGSVAERPVVAAAGTRAGGANGGSPDDDGDVVGEDAPGETAERARGLRGKARGRNGGGGGHAGSPKLDFSPRRREVWQCVQPRLEEGFFLFLILRRRAMADLSSKKTAGET